MGTPDSRQRFVSVNGRCYLESAFQTVLTMVGMERLSSAIEGAGTDRQLLRNVGALRNKDVAEEVRNEALRRLLKDQKVKGLSLLEVREGGGIVVAAFPHVTT